MPINPNVNRVALMIQQQEIAIVQRLATGQVTQERVDALNKTLNMELGEYCRFQGLKSLAVAGGKLTVDEGQLIYQHLGNSVETFNSQPVAVKAVLTQILQELLEIEIRSKRRAG